MKLRDRVGGKRRRGIKAVGKALGRSRPRRSSFFEQLEPRQVMTATLYHVAMVGSFRWDFWPDRASHETVNGSLSIADGWGSLIEADSIGDALAALLSGSVTSDEGATYSFDGFGAIAGEPSANGYSLWGCFDDSGANYSIAWDDPHPGHVFGPDYSIYGYGGYFDLKVTESSLNAAPVCPSDSTLAGAPGAEGDNPPMNGSTNGGLQNTSGQYNLALGSNTLFAGSNFGVMFDMPPRLNNQSTMADVNSAPNIAMTPQILRLSASEYAVVASGQVRYFDEADGIFTERDWYHDSLVDDTGDGLLVFSDSAGDSYAFCDFGGSRPLLERGQLDEIIDAGGNVAKVTSVDGNPAWNDLGQPNYLQLTTSDGGVTTVDTYTFNYNTSGNYNDPNAGEIESITLSRKIGSASEFNVAQEAFEYYPTNSSFLAANVKFILTQEWSGSAWQTVDTTYLREDDYGNITYVFENASYTQLLAAFGSATAIEAAPDVTSGSTLGVAPYADIAVTYASPSDDPVVESIVSKGTGCSACAGGLGAFDYSITTSDNADGYNNWKYKMVEQTMDGTSVVSTQTVYANYRGEVMLTVMQSGGQTWRTYYRYDDDNGNLLEVASPAAVTGYDTSDTPVAGLDVTLSPDTGLITHTDYYTSEEAGSATTISGGTVSPSGSGTGATEFVKDHWTEEGSEGRSGDGNWTYTDYTTYYNVTADYSSTDVGANYVLTLHPVAATTVFSAPFTHSVTTTTGAESTAYTYTFYAGKLWAQQETTTLPDVSSTGDEGTGVGGSDTIVQYFNQQGRPIWTKEPTGTIDYTAYDTPTGAITEMIQDVSSSGASAVGGLPSGWSLASGSHLNLTTVDVVDDQGRTAIAIDPNNDVTFTAIDDLNHETRVYTGWIYTSGSYTDPGSYSQDTSSTRPPVQVEVDELPVTIPYSVDGYADTYSQMLTMTQVAASSGTAFAENGVSLPIGGEAIANVQSLSVAVQNKAGQTVEQDEYYDLAIDHFGAGTSAWAYSAGPDPFDGELWNPGTPSTPANYYATVLAYDDEGLQNKEITPDGTIYRTVHDALGRVTSTWIGGNGWNPTTGPTPPDDHPYSGYWSPTNSANMAEVSANEYDADSDLIRTVQFPAGNDTSTSDEVAAFRVTELGYNWLEQVVSVKQGALVSHSYYDPATSGGFAVEGIGGSLVDNASDEGASGDTTQRPITVDVLDNLGHVTNEYVYAGNGVDPGDIVAYMASNTDPNYDGLLQSDVANSFDARGREYQTTQYSVDPASGDVSTDTSGYNAPETGSVQFDANDNIVLTTNALGAKTLYTYDGAGRLVSQRDPNPSNGSTSGGPLTQFGYDAAGNMTSETDALSRVQSWTYDAAGRQLTASVGSGSGALTTQYQYDAAGQLQYVIDPNLDTTQYVDDALGRRIEIILPDPADGSADGDGPKTTLTYDGDSNVVSITDPVFNTTHYTYNLLDQLTSQSETVATSYYRVSGVVHYNYATDETDFSYNNLGDLTQKLDANVRTIDYSYNALGQRIQEQWFPSGSTTASNTISYAYTVLDGLTSTSDASSGYAMAFDGFGRQSSVDNLGSLTGGTPSAPDVVLNAQYDANGNRTVLDAVIAGTADFHNTYQYDYLKRQTQIIQQSNGGHAVAYKKVALQHDASNALSAILDYSTSSTLILEAGFGYDAYERIEALDWSDSNADGYGGMGGVGGTGYWEQLNYTYDNASRVTAITNGVYDSEGQTFTYDHNRQLTEADLGGYGGPFKVSGFTWDLNGNPTASGTSVPDGYGGYYSTSDNSYVIGAGNRLLSDGAYDYQYDASGNLVKRLGIASGTIAETDYAWDNRNRLVEVKNRSSVGGSVTLDVTYAYDMFDRLISRTQGSTTSRFVYDGANMVLAFNSSNALTNRYLWGPAVDQILAEEAVTSTITAGTNQWAATDDQGSVRDWVTNSGTLADHLTYDSFGAVTSGAATSGIEFAHDGVLRDAATGLEWHTDPSSGYTGRWYSPSARRWMSEDPTGLGPDSNPYRYVGNSPTNFVDPSGLAAPIVIHRGPWRGPTPGQNWEDFKDCAGSVLRFIIVTTDPFATQGCKVMTDPQDAASWPAIKRLRWKQKAAEAKPGEYSEENLDRMRGGKPPIDAETGQSKEFHHDPPQREVGPEGPVEDVWPWEHADIDPCRHYNGPRPSGPPSEPPLVEPLPAMPPEIPPPIIFVPPL
jgi:RHS repeat-associated protein